MTNKFWVFFLLLFVSLNAWTKESSLYKARVKLNDERGQFFNLENLKDKKVIMTMAYTRCQIMCPMIINKVKKVEALYKQKNIPVEVVVVTFDPRFDNPSRLHSYYRDELNIKHENWHFLVGSETQTRMLSLILGIKYSVNPKSKIIMHDNKILVLNNEGVIEKRYETLDEV